MSSLMKKVHTIDRSIKSISTLLPTTLDVHPSPSIPSVSPKNILSHSSTSTKINKKIQSKLPFPCNQQTQPKLNPYKTSAELQNQHAPVPSVQTKIRKHYSTDNHWIGAKLCPLQKNEFRLWLQNVNGFDISSNFNIFMEHFEHIKKYDIGFYSITESKLNPYNSYVNENIEEAFHQVHPGSSCILTNQFLNHDDMTQYGGVFSAVTKSLSHRVAGMGKDHLGRYNWIDFYGKDDFLRIYTVYRVNPGCDNTSGDDTCWTHQRTALSQQNCNVDPRKQIVIDLVKSIKEDIRMNRSILICGDINENVLLPTGFNQSLLDLGLINLIQLEVTTDEQFRSHNRGQNVIDGIWASPNLKSAVLRCGAAPFNFLFQSDHRGFFLDLDLQQFLDTSTIPLLAPAYRRLKYTIPKRVEAYATKGLDLWKHQKMNLRLTQLETKLPNETPESREVLLNKIDKEINDLMRASEKRCCNVGRHCTNLFSKDLQKALRNHRQCKMHLSKTLMNIGDGVTSLHEVKKVAQSKREAKRHLKKCQKDEKPLRDKMYEQLAVATIHMHPQRGKKKKSVLKQLHNCENSRLDANKIRFATKGPHPGALSYVLIPDISSYSETDRNHPSFDHTDIQTIWNRTQQHNGKDIQKWERLDDFQKVNELISQILIKHFGQSTGTPFANTYWKNKLSDPTFQAQLLEGTVHYDNSLPEEANELLKSFVRKPNVKEIPLLPTWKEFSDFIGKATEKTSSSPSGRHYGHYKALLHSAPSILKGIFKIMCLSLQYGIVLERWKKTITTVICKDDDTPYIHRLRPLHIVEAELQFFSKYQWSYKLINQAESLKNISPSQYGGRKNKQAQSSVINTIISFDLHRQLRQSFTFNDDDLRANYDRELAHYSAAETRSHGLSYEAGNMLTKITSQQKFHIKTKNGISSTYYTYTNDNQIWGLGQGISWAGSCWQFTATSIENCLKKTCCGAVIQSPNNSVTISPFLKFFIDDTTKICNWTRDLPSILHQTNYNMQKHFNYVISTGGTLALDKCRFYYITFAFDDNHEPYILTIEENPGALEVFDMISKSMKTIRRVEATEARKTLGCFVSPSHNQEPQFHDLRKKILEWKQSVTFSSLSPFLILKAYETILKPKLVYRLSTTSLSFQQCDDLMKLIRPTILHAHHTHRNFPKSILESSSLYAGFDFVHLYDLQGFEKLKFFSYHLRQMDDTGTEMLISLQYSQLSIGIQTSFYNLPHEEYSYLTDTTWCTHLWEYISSQCLSIDIFHPIRLNFQREHDVFIMDILKPLFNKTDLIKLNKIRISLKLLLLSDIADMRGRHILPDIRRGIQYRISNINFPHQTFDPTWIKLWSKACDKINNFISRNSLGDWYERNFDWTSKLSVCQKFLQINQTTFFYNDSTNTYQIKQDPLPPNIHFSLPADIHHTRVGYRILATCPSPSTYIPQPISHHYNTFTLYGEFARTNENEIITAIKTNQAKMCCDGSVLNRLGSFAYGIAPPKSDQFLFSQHAPVLGDCDQITSTRCELMGMLACVEYLKYLATKYEFDRKYFILITADNEAAIKAPKKNYLSTKYTFSSDMDIILHIKFLLTTLPFRIRFQHVKGHQDKHTAYEYLSTLAKLNVQMDSLAKKFFTHPENTPQYSVHSPFLYGSIVSISDHHSRIVSYFRKNLKRHSTGHQAEKQMAKALQIQTSKLHLIDWTNFSTTHRNQPKHLRSFLTKSIYHHLPTMSRQYTWKQVSSSLCPLCKSCEESPDHLFRCTHPPVQTFRRKKIQVLRDELNNLGTDPFLIRHILRVILQWTNQFDVPHIQQTTQQLEAQTAINEQLIIGIGNFLRGIIVWRLAHAQQQYFRQQKNFQSKADTWARKLTGFLFHFSHDIWTHRCTLVADNTDLSYEAQIRQKCRSLLVTLSTNPNQLPHSYRYLLGKKSHFHDKAHPRAIQSWLKRIQIGLEKAKNGQSQSSSDIRNWFPVTKNQKLPPSPQTEEITFLPTDPPAIPNKVSEVVPLAVPGLPFIPYQPTYVDNVHPISLKASASSTSNYHRDI